VQPDRHNAHIRRGPASRRQSPEVKADEAERLFNDPAFKRGFDGTEKAIVELIATSKHDGSPEFEACEREMCRTLRTLRSLKRAILITIQGQKLRVADFKPIDPDQDQEQANGS
jgi:hypothetical protein